MMTAIDLIHKERQEQIHKHGFTLRKDGKYYKKGELVQAALFCIQETTLLDDFLGLKPHTHATWPEDWHIQWRDKIMDKSDLNKLIVAGALYMAENDRLRDETYKLEIIKICEQINKLIIQDLYDSLEGIVEIGKRDLSNPKYDGYFKTAGNSLERYRKQTYTKG